MGPAAVLGRIDIDDISDNQSLFVNAYIHPELRLRVVPTANAPDRATIPSNFCQLVQKRMNRKLPEREYSLPLKPFVTERDRPRGEFIAGEKELMNNGKYSVDICFASLGWLSFLHEQKFTLIPHCVEGSVFSKRRSLYPSNLAQWLLDHSDDIPEHDGFDDLDSETVERRLRDASRRGRHNEAQFDTSDEWNDGHSDWEDESDWV